MIAKPANPLRLLLSNADYLYRKTLLDLRTRYKKTLLGIGWVIAMPLFFLALYATVHMVIYRLQPHGVSGLPLVIMMFIGLMCIFGVSESLSASSSAFSHNKNLLLNSYMPPEVLIAQSSMFGFINCLMGIGIAVAALLLTGHGSWHMLLAPLVLFLQMLFVVGLGWIFSILTLLIKDLHFMIRFLTLTLVIISPIAYTQDMVPPRLGVILYANPVSYFIIAYQDLLILGKLPSFNVAGAMLVISSATFIVGYRFFTRMRTHVVDYL